MGATSFENVGPAVLAAGDCAAIRLPPSAPTTSAHTTSASGVSLVIMLRSSSKSASDDREGATRNGTNPRRRGQAFRRSRLGRRFARRAYGGLAAALPAAGALAAPTTFAPAALATASALARHFAAGAPSLAQANRDRLL